MIAAFAAKNPLIPNPLAQPPFLQVDLPPAVMRDGGDFQARIPERIAARPGGREADHPCAGLPGPNTLEALAIAAGMEKESSDRMPIDAVADPEYHPGQGGLTHPPPFPVCRSCAYLHASQM